MSDVLLFQTNDNGEIAIPSGEDVTLTNGFETCDYLSLFGGNAEDDGTTATERAQWWGNVGELDTNRTYRGAFQALLERGVLTGDTLRRMQRAAEGDLAWKVTSGLAETLTVSVTSPERNRVAVRITQTISGRVIESREMFTMGTAA
jgi:phage gp46-like protein